MPQQHRKRALARTAVIGLAAATAVLAFNAPASAHVTVTPTGTDAGSYTVLTFSVGHGCDGEATTAVAIQIPEPLNAVTPTVNPGWDLEKVYTELAEPVVDNHGNEISERVGEVRYTAHTPLPDDYRDVFALSLRLPEETAGQTLHFPVVQSCGDSEHAWIQIAEEGQNPDELDSPAPFIEVTGPGAAPAAEDPDSAGADDADTGTTETAADEGGDALTYVALAIGALGTILGALALFRGRRTT